MRHRKGFTLIELLIVISVIGIMAAIAIPSLLNALQRGRQKRTMGDLRTLGTACELYSMDHDDYVVQAAGSLSSVSGHLEPTCVKAVPDRDGWSSDFVYEGLRDQYTITSYGKDRLPGGGGAVASNGTTTDFRNDIVFCDGGFMIFPEGVQE